MSHRSFAVLLALLATPGMSSGTEVPVATVSVCSANVIFVRLAEGTTWPSPTYKVELFRLPDDPDASFGSAPTRVGEFDAIRQDGRDPTFLQTPLSEDIQGNKQYGVSVKTEAGAVVATGRFSTKPKATITPSRTKAEASYRFDVHSALRLKPLTTAAEANVKLIEIRRKALLRANDSGGFDKLCERTLAPRPVRFFRLPREGTCDQIELRQLGSAVFDLIEGDHSRPGSAGLRLTGLQDVLGQDVAAEGDMVPIKAPKGKDDSNLYAKVNFETAKETADSYAVDVRLAPPGWQTGRLLFRPELTASISKNVPKSTNSLRLAGLLSYTTTRQDADDWHLQSSTWQGGPAFEGDRNLDRLNLVADFRWHPDLRGSYNSREIQQIAQAAAAGKKLSEIEKPATGWGLEFTVGVEVGRSLKRQTIENKANTETLSVDTYEVLRARPQLHGFFEVWQFTFDVSSSLRYLFTTEDVGRERDDGALEVQKIKGLHACTEVTASYAFDEEKHFSLAVGYKNGGEPPSFEKVNKYTVGFLAKY